MIRKLVVVLLPTIFFCFQGFTQVKNPNLDSLTFPDQVLQEMVIKASKSNSKLGELPISVSVLSKHILEMHEISSLNQINGISPNFVMPDYGSKLTSPIYIRGIGSRINAPSVGLYVDNVPNFEKSSFEFDFFDISRVEILRGPQGTLYGRNSMGGLINVITRSPMAYQGTHFNASAAGYGSYKFSIGHYIKINDDFGLSLSGNFHHNDGYYTNQYFNSEADELNSYGLRNKLIYNFSKRLTVENIAGLENSKQGGYPYSIFVDSTKTAKAVNYNQYSSYNRFMFSDAINVKYTGSNFEFTNTTSYQFFDDAQNIDQDFTVDSLYFVKQNQRQNMFSNEIVFRSKGNSRYNFIIGGFAFTQLFDTDVAVDVYASNMWYIKTYGSDVLGFALFHQSTYKITEQLSVIAGLRFDSEKSGLHYKYNAIRNGNPLPSIDTVYNDLKDQIVLPKIAFNYQLKNSSFYASYTTGYKPGGFNSTFERPEHLMFKNERSHNYEAGAKSSFLNNAFYVDFALFYTLLKKQQIYRTVPSGRGSYLDNAGISENKGFEFSMRNSPYKGFEGMVAYGYTHSEILEYVKDENVNYNGNFTPYIPRHTLAIQLTQTIKISNSMFLDKLVFNVLYNQNGKQYWDLENKYLEKSFGLLNMKISAIRKKLQIDIWGKNLSNTKYHAFLFQALGNTYVQVGKPMQFGLTVSVKL